MNRSHLLALAATAIVLAGCGSSRSSSSSPATSTTASSTTSASASGPAGAGVIQAKMQNFAFTPKVIHARVGQSVRWVNEDSAPHNVTGTGGPHFTPSPTFGQGGSFTLKLSSPGTYTYICTVHPFMKATLVVSR